VAPAAANRGKRSGLWLSLFSAAAVVALALGASGAGADGITPGSTTLNLGVGSSTTLNETLHLDALPPRADILLALDTTGSMGAAIADARTDANTIVASIQDAIPGARFAVADFKDYPDVRDTSGNPVLGYGGFPFGGPGDYPWQVDQDFTTNEGTIPCGALGDLSPIECAVSRLTASGGADEPEAYNRAFYETYHDTAHLTYQANAPRFLIVLGDSLPHDAALNTSFPHCPNTGPTDPGPDSVVGTSDDLATQPTLTALRQNNTNVSFVTYNEPHSIGGLNVATCQGELAAYTGGTAVTHGAGTGSLGTQIIDLINAAAGHVDNVTFNVTGSVENPGSWFSFDPPLPYGPITAPADVSYRETVTVPQTAAPGTYDFDVHAIADGSERAVQHVTVNVSRRSVSALALTADETSIPAGIKAVPYGSIPASRLSLLTPDVNSAPAGSIPAGSIPAGSIPAGSIPAGSIPAGSIPAGSIPAGSIGLGVSPAGSIPAGSIPAGSIALTSVLLSQLPIVGTTWADILKESPFAFQPLQAVSLDDIAHYETRGSDGKTPWERLMALPIKNLPFLTSLWRNVPFAALMLGNQPLNALPTPKKPDGTQYTNWTDALTANGGSTTGVDFNQNTVFGVAISGQLGSTPAGSIPAGSIPAGSIPAGSIPAGSINITGTRLASILLSDLNPLSDIVTCGNGFSCTGKTLGDAYTAQRIKPTATLDTIFSHLPSGHPARQMTIDEIIQAMLPLSDYPWEQILVQGLQDIGGTGKNVHYHADFDLDCSLATSFSVHVRLPAGFFPVRGSSKFSYAGGTPLAAAEPTMGANGPVWSTLPGSPCGGTTLTRHVRLDFTSFAGLTLGTQSSSVDVTAGGTYTASDQAPVLVTQNWEPNDDSGNAPTVDKNTLIVGHIANSGDVDYFRFPLTGLASGTKVAAFLKTAPGTDFDLAINKPGAPTIQPSPAGSIPAGSIGIEDSAPSVDNSHGALPPDTLADVPAGSIPAGSIPAGSISANRGAVNEVVQIVTRGESGNAVIGVSGYNGAFSNDNYVLRIKVTPPPTLPPCPAITGLGTATPGTLPSVGSVSPLTKTLFLVDRQRLAGMYSAARADALLSATGPLATVAARPEVRGVVLPVDGNGGVRSAYAAWDANPCSVDAANGVVRAINGVVSTYRASLPNLKYVVLLGTDQALPSWRQQDLTALSPEIDNAQELAFTTNNLTQGNSTYASSALNTVLADGAYGAFAHTTFLGHDLPLPQVSVSRLVETPEEIAGQFTQYLTANGQLDIHSALTTGDDFFVDGGQAASSALNAQFGLGAANDTLFPPTSLWTRADLLSHFFDKTGGVPDAGALFAHYNHWLAQPASIPALPTATDFLTTADVTTRSQLLFTIGCHGGFNLPDTIGGPIAAGDVKRQRDWPQAYSQIRTAVYVANSGFGYGDTKIVDFSERLMRGFARNLNTGGTVGEQWVRALHDYYATAGSYDVVDEKVMVEANMYGLPFYGYTGTPQNIPPTPTPPPTHDDGGLLTATLPAITANITQHDAGDGQSLFYDDAQPDGTTNAAGIRAGTLSVIYRPVQPQLSRDVTVPGTAAHGAFITALTTPTIQNVRPVKPFPLVFSGDERPASDYPSIFFPAGLVTVNRDVSFGRERATAVVNMGRFKPNNGSDAGTEQVVDSIGLDVGYSTSSDVTPPQITQVGGVRTGTGSFTAFVRVSDSGGLHRVAVLWSDGGAVWQVKELTNAGGDLWTGTITSSASSILLDGEAQDNAGNVGFSFNKAVNFQSVQDTSAPAITLVRPLPGALFTLNNQVTSSFLCSDPGGVASCVGRSDAGPDQPSGSLIATDTLGPHTFTVTATDLSGHTTSRAVTYFVLGIFGFKPPVDNPPVLNLVNAGNTIPVKWTLRDAAGNFVRDLSAFTSVSSVRINCTSATTDPDPDVVPAGLAGLHYDLANEQFVYNWQTQRAWAGTCRRLIIGLVGNGVLPYADFKFN
jgi:hypothetical protein